MVESQLQGLQPKHVPKLGFSHSELYRTLVRLSHFRAASPPLGTYEIHTYDTDTHKCIKLHEIHIWGVRSICTGKEYIHTYAALLHTDNIFICYVPSTYSVLVRVHMYPDDKLLLDSWDSLDKGNLLCMTSLYVRISWFSFERSTKWRSLLGGLQKQLSSRYVYRIWINI